MAWQWWQRTLAVFAPAASTYESLIGMGASPGVTTETQVRCIVASAGNLKLLRVVLNTAPGAGNSRTFTIYKNGSGSALTVTISDTATSALITTDVAVVAGDRLSIETARSGTPASAGDAHIAVAFEPTTTDQFSYPIAWANGSAIINSIPRYNPALGSSSGTPSSDTIGSTKSVIPIACTLDAFYVDIRNAPGVGTDWTLILVKNGTEEASTSITISAGTTTGNVTGLGISLSVGDVLTFKVKAKTGSPTTTYCGWGVRLIPSTTGQWILGGQTTSAPSVSATNYFPIVDTNGTSPNATETVVDIPVPFAINLIALAMIVAAAPTSGKSWTVRSRNNAGNGNVNFTIADAATSGNDGAHSDSLVLDDLIDFSTTPSGTPTSMGESAWAMAFSTTVAPIDVIPDPVVVDVLVVAPTISLPYNITPDPVVVEVIVVTPTAVFESNNEVWVETWETQE